MLHQFINGFTIAAFCAFKNFETGSEGSCNTELVRTEHISNVRKWEGSDQAAV